ncbi:MAG: exodeoxyribonuclease VII large subunit [Candidatus Moraniibacteriota bacterium]
MTPSLHQALRQWRDRQANMEGVESYRVLSNAVLDALAITRPQSKEEMLEVKGIKEARFRKYGKALLGILSEHGSEAIPAPKVNERGLSSSESENASEIASQEPLSVSQFLDGLNVELSGLAARIRGEVTSLDIRERVVYFSLKDPSDESTLPCFIFRSAYALSGVPLALGDEVVVEGVPNVYKPLGRLAFQVGFIELFGEGALKKAYDLLFQKLESAGIFAQERKRELPLFCERIALITSKDGAAIDDFRMNLSLSGMRVSFYPTAVEGKRAVLEILAGIKYFNQTPEKFDALVVIRGGGSLESLQAFNNEMLVQAVADSKIPTLLGIGHEKDVTLAALAADRMVSTPTATAKLLSQPWSEARSLITHFEQHLPLLFQERLVLATRLLDRGSEGLLTALGSVRDQVRMCEQGMAERIVELSGYVRERQTELSITRQKMQENFRFLLLRVRRALEASEEALALYDPRRALALGYSLIKKGERVLKTAGETRVGDILDIQLGRGSLSAEVKTIHE